MHFDAAEVTELTLDKQNCVVRFTIAFDDVHIMSSAKTTELFIGGKIVHHIDHWMQFQAGIRHALDEEINLARLLLNDVLKNA